jgi:V/A-type H+-transporting ATPase subunit I
MERITLLCRNESAARITELLAQLRVLHITTHRPERILPEIEQSLIGNGMPAPDTPTLAAALLKARHLAERIGPAAAKDASDTKGADIPYHLPNLETCIAKVEELAEEYAHLEEGLKRMDAERTTLEQRRRLLELLLPLDEPIGSVFSTKSVRTVIIRGDIPAGLSPLRTLPTHDATILLLLPQDAAKVEAQGVDISPLREEKATPAEAIARTDAQLAEVATAIAQIRQQQVSYSNQRAFLASAELVLAKALLLAKAPESFGQTQHITIIRGYAPSRRVPEIERSLHENNLLALVEREPADDAPTLLRNPPVVRDFEELLSLYALPNYREIDPTSVMAITFPVFFGFMLGDIGYGLIALLVAAALYRRMPKLRHLSVIFILSAVSTVIFGVLFGEMFGESIGIPPLLHRTGDVGALFALAIAMGILHIALGLVFGAINEARHGTRQAVGKLAWLCLLCGGLLAVRGYGLLDSVALFWSLPATSPGLGVIMGTAGIAGILVAERAKGLLEIPMLLSNIISYVRLVALGLASVAIAFVVNDLARGLFLQGTLGIVAGVALLLVGHALNLAIGLLGAFLHALRLHYVEFYTKFYEGGGQAYHPFGEPEARPA